MDTRGPAAILCLIALLITLPHSQGDDVFELVGADVRLPCPVNPADCGPVHSIKWYKDSQRIFVFSEAARISRPESTRVEIDYIRNKSESSLLIKKAVVEDEGVYRCEITYVEVSDTCPAVHHINFTTLIKPEQIKAWRTGRKPLANGTVVKGITEDEDIKLFCESGPAKPTPIVQWWNGSTLISGDGGIQESDEAGTGRAVVKFTVSRADLGVNYECRAQHRSLLPLGYLFTTVQLDVDVRPKGLKMEGVKPPIYSGNRVELVCLVEGARPAANVTWYNGTTHLQESSSKLSVAGDGTFDTTSRLSFTATRFENEQSLSCEATNEIMTSRNEDPMRQTISLEVMYPPIVTVSPENITVNESTDVLMFCQYVANPATLKSVKWLRDDSEIDLKDGHYEGANTEQTSLLIKNATRADMGNYTCVLENDVGDMPSGNFVFVSIHFKPETVVVLDPPSPVVASPEVNVTLRCQVSAGNPTALTHVQWYLDGESVASLPNCANSTFCGLNPSEVVLGGITTTFHGNWTCIGKNQAGWGPISPPTQLVVYYPPSGAKLEHSPDHVVKQRSMTLYCSVRDRGRPDNTTFRWTRGGLPVTDVTTANYTIQSVTLASESNFTCTAVNLGGESQPATVFIKVHAPPTFIMRLPPYVGALMTSSSVSMTCRVECSPICSIMWLKNGHRLETGPHARYYVENTVIPPDTRTNDFESVQSTLVWNMTAWPGGQLDRVADNANYTCASTGNAVGQGVKSSTFFGVEYPPELMDVSNKVVNVKEGNVPEKVLCHAKAYPEASYHWIREGESEVIIKGNALILNYPISRKNGGNYVCEAFNKHGNNSKTTRIDVLYKPECGIVKKEVDGKVVLECTAIANPQDVNFFWKIKNENETIEEHIEQNGLKSILTLETRVENFRTYLCFANNTAGVSIPCEMDVSGSVSWWWRLENENLMILLAIIAGVILMVIIICIIIIIVCRRKRAADKYNNTLELEDRENPEGNCNNNNNNNTSGRSGSGGRGKWPLRPGVLVHVNTNHSLLTNNTGSPPTNQGTLIDTQESRAARIKNMFSSEQTKSGTIPGVFSSRNGVVTFKRLDPAADTGTARRQKSSSVSDATVNKDNKNPSPNDALLPPDGDKAFYENLPFHNMQNPPNKVVKRKVVCVYQPSRPPSRISSGYGSARSQCKIGARKFLTVKPLGSRTRGWPIFRSLRCTRTSAEPPVPAPRQFLTRPASEKHVYQNVPGPIDTNTSPCLPVDPPGPPEPDPPPSDPPEPSSTTSNPPEDIEMAEKTGSSFIPLPIFESPSLSPSMNAVSERLGNTNSERRVRPRRKAGHHGSAREINQPSIRDDYPKFKTTPHNTRNGSPPRAGHHRAHRPHHTSPRNHAEYAFIKFHDVGQEIDV